MVHIMVHVEHGVPFSLTDAMAAVRADRKGFTHNSMLLAMKGLELLGAVRQEWGKGADRAKSTYTIQGPMAQLLVIDATIHMMVTNSLKNRKRKHV